LTSSDQFYKREKEREEGELANAVLQNLLGMTLQNPKMILL